MGERVNERDGTALAVLAAAVVGARLFGRPYPRAGAVSSTLRVPAASFVTLESSGALRGCVGTLEASRPLYLDVARNAVRAMRDPRLPPVTISDWPSLEVKVSVLSEPELLAVRDLGALLAVLRPGVDGLLLADSDRRATFLPAVWQKVPEPAHFVAALLSKGGWPGGEWPARLTVLRYTAIEFRDPPPRQPLAVPGTGAR
jgi:AmmeMemoRadiSam system protein A